MLVIYNLCLLWQSCTGFFLKLHPYKLFHLFNSCADTDLAHNCCISPLQRCQIHQNNFIWEIHLHFLSIFLRFHFSLQWFSCSESEIIFSPDAGCITVKPLRGSWLFLRLERKWNIFYVTNRKSGFKKTEGTAGETEGSWSPVFSQQRTENQQETVGFGLFAVFYEKPKVYTRCSYQCCINVDPSVYGVTAHRNHRSARFWLTLLKKN